MTDEQKKAYYEALWKVSNRYFTMIPATEQHAPLRNFLFNLRSELLQEAPLMKMNRWLGYIQGQMIAAELTTVDEERDFTRPLFRPLDFPNE